MSLRANAVKLAETVRCAQFGFPARIGSATQPEQVFKLNVAGQLQAAVAQLAFARYVPTMSAQQIFAMIPAGIGVDIVIRSARFGYSPGRRLAQKGRFSTAHEAR